jgi:hypothetical protein
VKAKTGTWFKIILPLTVAIVSFLTLWIMTEVKLAKVEFLRVNRDISVGEEITTADLDRLALSGEATQAGKGLLLYSDRSLIIGRPAPRNLVAGDVLLKSDAQTIQPELQAGAGEEKHAIQIPENFASLQDLKVGSQVTFRFARASSRSAYVSQFQNANQATPEAKTSILVGPFRLLGVQASPVNAKTAQWNRDPATLVIGARLLRDNVTLDAKTETLHRYLQNNSGWRLIAVNSSGNPITVSNTAY